jgi:hypothetical protein
MITAPDSLTNIHLPVVAVFVLQINAPWVSIAARKPFVGPPHASAAAMGTGAAALKTTPRRRSSPSPWSLMPRSVPDRHALALHDGIAPVLHSTESAPVLMLLLL